MNTYKETTIDARTLQCPRPLIMAKQELTAMEQGELTVLVDNATAVANLQAFAETSGFAVRTEQLEGHYAVSIGKTAGCELASAAAVANVVALISSDHFGSGDEQFSKTLMRNYIFALTEVEAKPATMLFVNSGAFFTCEGSPVLDSLQALAEAGVEILTCGACVDFYSLKLVVGQVTNMYVIAEKLLAAGQVVRV